MMVIEYLSKQQYKKMSWGGGQTIEVCLSPKDIGEYKVGKFDYRISSATIELEESEFSQLPGYKRIILTLDRAIQLSHDDEIMTLLPLTPHYFDGGQPTKSIGTCTDFNLIYRPEFIGDMSVLKKVCELELRKHTHYIIFAIHDLAVLIEGREFEVAQGDSLSIDSADNSEVISLKSFINQPFGILVAVSRNV